MRKYSAAIALLVTFSTTSRPLWAASSFTPLGQLCVGCSHSQAYGMSADGTVVSGTAETIPGDGTSLQAFRWTQLTGKVSTGLPRSGGIALSKDGVWVAGAYSVSVLPYRWSDATGKQDLGPLPGGNGNGQARGISHNGRVIVGIGNSANTGPVSPPFEAFRWYVGDDGSLGTTDDEMIGLGDLSGGSFNSTANGVSPNGNLVVGTGSTTANGEFAVAWTAGPGNLDPTKSWNVGTPVVHELPSLCVGCQSIARSTSGGDGSIIVGTAEPALGSNFTVGGDQQAVYWGGIHSLGDLPNGQGDSVAEAVSADGSIIVGTARTVDGKEAFIWTAALGMRNLETVLNATGANIDPAWLLGDANGISDDGRVITGFGINPSGAREAWVAVVPEPGRDTLLLAGVLGLFALRVTRSRFDRVYGLCVLIIRPR